MPYAYDFPHPAVTADAIPLRWRDGHLSVLFIRRGKPPFEGRWAFPGGFVGISEELEAAARREMLEETGIEAGYMEQLAAFGGPDRDPRERVVTVAFLAPLPADHDQAAAGASDAAEAKWFPVEALPRLAFDHGDIMAQALERIMILLQTTPFALYLMPQRFQFKDVSSLYDHFLGEKLRRRRWQEWLTAGLISEEAGGYRLCVALELNEL